MYSAMSFWAVPFLLLTLWSLVWKGAALWRASRLGEKVWFWVLLVVNTAGILEILYIFAFSRDKKLDIKASPNVFDGLGGGKK